MGQWIRYLGRMYQTRGSDESPKDCIAMREYPSAIERRKSDRRRNWIDPDPLSERQFRRKQIRRKHEL
jgi:hypothetical protein